MKEVRETEDLYKEEGEMMYEHQGSGIYKEPPKTIGMR
jgi:hypothetical protein